MSSTATLTSPIPVPEVDTDEPVAVIPTASVAPLDGPPDGERINTFRLAPADEWAARGGAGALGDLRGRVLRKPLTGLAVAFSLGWVLARMLR